MKNCDGYVPVTVGTAIASCSPGGRRQSHHVNSADLRFCQPLPRNMWETHDPAGDIHDKYNLTGNGHSP